MTENMKKYLELVSKDEELQKKIAKIEAEHKANLIKEVIELAGEHGITLAEADFVADTPNGELSDDELDAVAGGSACGCFSYGAGNPGKESVYGCACIIAGVGGDDSSTRCVCVFGGGGKK